MAKKRTDERNGENVEGEEPNFEDPEDFVDDISEQGKCIQANYLVIGENVGKNILKIKSASLNDSVALTSCY